MLFLFHYAATLKRMLWKERQLAWPWSFPQPHHIPSNTSLSPLSWAAYPLSRIQNIHTGIPSPRAPERKSRNPSGILPRPPESFVSSGRLELLLSCECLRHLLDAIHGCLHLGSSESLRNCPGIIKMQTIPRLHNSTCKRVSGWPWLFIEKPIKSPHLGSWTEYRFEDNILGPYGKQQPFPCMLQLLLSFVVHCPLSLITTPWNYRYL